MSECCPQCGLEFHGAGAATFKANHERIVHSSQRKADYARAEKWAARRAAVEAKAQAARRLRA